MDEVNPNQQSTSILELLYLFRAMNRGDIPFAEGMKLALQWSAAVIAEHETGQHQLAPSQPPMQPAQGEDADGCQSYQ